VTEEEYKKHLEIFKKAMEYLNKNGSMYYEEDCRNELTDAYEAGYMQALSDEKTDKE